MACERDSPGLHFQRFPLNWRERRSSLPLCFPRSLHVSRYQGFFLFHLNGVFWRSHILSSGGYFGVDPFGGLAQALGAQGAHLCIL